MRWGCIILVTFISSVSITPFLQLYVYQLSIGSLSTVFLSNIHPQIRNLVPDYLKDRNVVLTAKFCKLFWTIFNLSFPFKNIFSETKNNFWNIWMRTLHSYNIVFIYARVNRFWIHFCDWLEKCRQLFCWVSIYSVLDMLTPKGILISAHFCKNYILWRISIVPIDIMTIHRNHNPLETIGLRHWEEKLWNN